MKKVKRRMKKEEFIMVQIKIPLWWSQMNWNLLLGEISVPLKFCFFFCTRWPALLFFSKIDFDKILIFFTWGKYFCLQETCYFVGVYVITEKNNEKKSTWCILKVKFFKTNLKFCIFFLILLSGYKLNRCRNLFFSSVFWNPSKRKFFEVIGEGNMKRCFSVSR